LNETSQEIKFIKFKRSQQDKSLFVIYIYRHTQQIKSRSTSPVCYILKK